jgi:hypothetical protein
LSIPLAVGSEGESVWVLEAIESELASHAIGGGVLKGAVDDVARLGVDGLPLSSLRIDRAQEQGSQQGINDANGNRQMNGLPRSTRDVRRFR